MFQNFINILAMLTYVLPLKGVLAVAHIVLAGALQNAAWVIIRFPEQFMEKAQAWSKTRADVRV